MSYKCELCLTVVPHGVKRTTVLVRRVIPETDTLPERTEIVREIPVCRGCKAKVDRGETLSSLVKWRIAPVEKERYIVTKSHRTNQELIDDYLNQEPEAAGQIPINTN